MLFIHMEYWLAILGSAGIALVVGWLLGLRQHRAALDAWRIFGLSLCLAALMLATLWLGGDVAALTCAVMLPVGLIGHRAWLASLSDQLCPAPEASQ